jgi:hypothetical protein
MDVLHCGYDTGWRWTFCIAATMKIDVEAPAPGYFGCERSSEDGTADGGDTEIRAEYSLEHGPFVEWDREHHDDYTSAEDPGCSKTGDCSSNDESFRVGCGTTNCGLQEGQ